MELFVTVKPGSRNPGLDRSDESRWIIRVREPAAEGKANAAVIAAVARELGVPKSKVSLTRGLKSRQKTLEIEL